VRISGANGRAPRCLAGAEAHRLRSTWGLTLGAKCLFDAASTHDSETRLVANWCKTPN